MDEFAKTLGQYESIKIGYEGKEGYLLISGNGDVKNNIQTDGESVNIFEYPAETGQQAAIQNGYSGNWDEFHKQERYLQLLIQVSSGTGYKVNTEIEEAIAKIKELTYAESP